MERALKEPPLWQRVQSTFWCAPVRGKRVLAWSTKVAGFQPLAAWQESHFVGKPLCWWFGFRVAL